MKFLYFGDLHIALKLGNRTESYPQDILAKLRWVYETAKEHNVDAILQGGDWFHFKSNTKNPHWLVQASHEAIGAGDIPVIVVCGNHDLASGTNINSLDQQALGSLIRMKGFLGADGGVEGYPIFGIPYMDEEDAAKSLPKILRKAETWRKKNKYDTLILMSHLSVFPPGSHPPYDYIDATDYAELVVNKDIPTTIFNGHIHHFDGAYTPLGEGSNIQVVNTGSLSRGSLTGENLKKVPQVALFDTETHKVEFLDVPVKPAEQVFKLDSAGAVKERKASMTNFLDSLQSDAVEVTSSSQVVDKAKADGVESSVVNQIEILLEWTE